MKFTLRDDGKRLFLVCLGALIFSFNMKSFVRAGNLLPGGIAGITVLIQQIGNEYFHVSIPYSVGNLLLNSIPIFYRNPFCGKEIYAVQLSDDCGIQYSYRCSPCAAHYL